MYIKWLSKIIEAFDKMYYAASRDFPIHTVYKMEVVQTVTNRFTDNAKVMSKGQVIIPKDIRKILGVSCGDRITFVVENGSVRLINSAIYAMQILQAQMEGEAENTGLTSDSAVMDMVKEMRTESVN